MIGWVWIKDCMRPYVAIETTKKGVIRVQLPDGKWRKVGKDALRPVFSPCNQLKPETGIRRCRVTGRKLI